jgi:hypothetical protein
MAEPAKLDKISGARGCSVILMRDGADPADHSPTGELVSSFVRGFAGEIAGMSGLKRWMSVISPGMRCVPAQGCPEPSLMRASAGTCLPQMGARMGEKGVSVGKKHLICPQIWCFTAAFV